MATLRIVTIFLTLCASGSAFAAGITNYSSHKPSSVTLPSARGAYTDPVFGTRIIRVTDSRDGTVCTHAYSYWPAFNYNTTRLMISCDDVIKLFKFSPSTGILTADGTLTGTTGYKVQFEGATWSETLSYIVYAADLEGTRLWRIDVKNRGAGGYTLIKDFASSFPGMTVNQLHVSSNHDVYSFHTKNSSNVPVDAVVWVKSTNRKYVFPRRTGWVVNEVNLSKDGLQAMVSWESGAQTFWNFRNGTYKDYQQSNLTANISGHFDMGQDFIANNDGVNTGLVVRNYGALLSPENIVQYKRPDGSLNWSIADHVSLRSGEEIWAVGSTYGGDKTYGAFEDEIYMARTDGGGFVRLAHTRSYENSANRAVRYFAQPRAVIDRSGRFIVYTSDLGSSSRTDVMILKVPSAYWPQ
jgi:hypothetical protein